MRTVVIYPGRFQPMLKHHVEVYNQLQRDYPDADVYIGTSNKVDGDKSPFNFLEKQEIAGAHGIGPDKIIQVTNPYNKDDYDFDKDKTLLIFAIGEKDKSRLPVNNIDPTSGLNVKKTDGKASYLQDIALLSREGYVKEPMSKRGYVALAPNVSSEGEIESASAFRKSFAGANDIEHAKEIFSKQFGEFNETVFNLLYNKLVRKEMTEQINRLKKLAGLQEAAPVVYTPDKEVYGYEEPEPGLNFDTDDFEPFDRKKSPAKQSRTFEPTSPKDAKSSAARPEKAAGSNPDQAEFIPFDPDKFGRKHQKFSVANRFGNKDSKDQQDKQDVFLQELLKSPGNILAEINSRLANDDNSLAVGDRLSSIISDMPSSGIGGLDDDDKKFVIKLVANAVKNMDLAEPFYDPEEDLEDSVNFDDIRSEYNVVETKLTEKKTFMIGAKKTNGERGILVLKKGGIFSSDKDDIVLGNHPREVARQLVKHGYGPGDRFDYHYTFKKAQTADPAYGFRHGEVSDIMGDVENAIYFDQDQQDLFSQPRKDPMKSDDLDRQLDKTGTESVEVNEGGDCHHCKGDDPDCEHCDGSGYVQFDDDPQEPSQEEIDAYWEDVLKLSGVEKDDVDENAIQESEYWDWDDPEKGYRHGAGYEANLALWMQEITKERSQHGDEPYSREEMVRLFDKLAKNYGVDIEKEKQIDADAKEAEAEKRKADMKSYNPFKNDKELDMASKVNEDGHLPEVPYDNEVEFGLEGDDGEYQDGTLEYTVIGVDHEADNYDIKIDPKSFKWSMHGNRNASAKLDHPGDGTQYILDSEYLTNQAMDAAIENEVDAYREYWHSYAQGMEPASVQEGPSPLPDADSLFDVYKKGGEEGLCKVVGCTLEELNQEIKDVARDYRLHPVKNRDRCIQLYIEELVDDAEEMDGPEVLDPDVEMESASVHEDLVKLKKLAGLT